MENPFIDMVDQSARATEALGADIGVVADLDMIDLGRVARHAIASALADPEALAAACFRFGVRGLGATANALATGLGVDSPPVVSPEPRDRRYSDPAWTENALFRWILQGHLLLEELVDDLVETADLEGSDGEKLKFLADLLVNAAQPNNFLLTNPTALTRAFETGGLSVVRGMRNMVDDIINNGGYPRQVDTKPFKAGVNLANTPGKVVFRNELIELLQFEPTTAKVHKIPIVCSPPWINKYYVMDLAPERSLIEWAVTNGHTVFAISYRNPDPSMASYGPEDYLFKGAKTAIDIAKEITGADKVNLLSLCLGGTLSVMTAAYLTAIGDDSINSLTCLNTLVDFSEPGQLAAFTDEASIARIEARLDKEGVLHADDIRHTFDLLRPNELVFNYVASNWLMGEDPPAFDILAWNADSTNTSASMEKFMLRSLYLDNQLAQNELTIDGQQLDLSKIEADTFIVGAIKDHIVPWKSSYKTTQILDNADSTYVLSSSGHIAGVINPPGPKAVSWTNDADDADPDAWLEGATKHETSWWEIWATWAKKHGGTKVSPPPLGSDTYLPIEDAPGTYVHG